MGDSIEDIRNVSAEPSPSTLLYPHHRPWGDELAQGGQGSPLRPRTARPVSQQNADVLEQHAVPDRATLHQDAMTEAGRALPEELRYLAGNIDGSVDQ